MRIKINNRKSIKGITTVAVVVAISLTLTAIIVTIQAITLLNVRMAKSSVSEKSTFYAAEGIVYDTLARMNASYNSGTGDYGWPDTYGTPEQLPRINGINLTRTISFDPANDQYQIDVTASTKESSRRLVATLEKNTTGVTATDIILIIDHSGSMTLGGTKVCDASLCPTPTPNGASPTPIPITGWTNPPDNRNLDCSIFSSCQLISQPIYTASSAAQYFIDLIRDNSNASSIKTGYIRFETKAKLKKPLSNNHTDTYNFLKDISASGWTNIYQALNEANTEFANRSSGANKAIVLLTDGLPNMYDDPDPDNRPDCSIPDTPTTNTTYTNSDCVQQAFAMANTLKSNNVAIYTIGLGLAEPHDDLTQDQITFAKSFLNQISSSPSVQYAYYLPSWTDWTSDSTLHDVYASILQNILSTPYLDIKELPPE